MVPQSSRSDEIQEIEGKLRFARKIGHYNSVLGICAANKTTMGSHAMNASHDPRKTDCLQDKCWSLEGAYFECLWLCRMTPPDHVARSFGIPLIMHPKLYYHERDRFVLRSEYILLQDQTCHNSCRVEEGGWGWGSGQTTFTSLEYDSSKLIRLTLLVK